MEYYQEVDQHQIQVRGIVNGNTFPKRENEKRTLNWQLLEWFPRGKGDLFYAKWYYRH